MRWRAAALRVGSATVCAALQPCAADRQPRVPKGYPPIYEFNADSGQDPQLLWLRGPPGSGKSTVSGLAADELRRRGRNVAHLEADLVRNAVICTKHPSLMAEMLMVQADAALREGFDVVIDANLGYTKRELGAGIFAGSRRLVDAWLGEKPASAVHIWRFEVSEEEAARRHAGCEKGKHFALPPWPAPYAVMFPQMNGSAMREG